MTEQREQEVVEDSAPGEGQVERYKPNWGLHLLLLLVTLSTTTCTGLMQSGMGELPLPPDLYWKVLLTDSWVWGQALAYSLSVLAILFAHEMGHYIPARYYKVEVTPPYFLPGFPPFGTFGAFIKMQMEKMSASRLFRIGAGGPYAGFVVALPLLVIGLLLSEVKPVPVHLEGAKLGDSVLMWVLTRVIFGELPAGHDVFLHPMAFAGWVGLFVTAFNLVPLGQLDGGHIMYTLFGERYNQIVLWLLGGLILLGVTVFPGWLVLAVFLLLMDPEHPQILEPDDQIKGAERFWGYGAIVLFVLTFTPRPFEVPTLLDLFMN